MRSHSTPALTVSLLVLSAATFAAQQPQTPAPDAPGRMVELGSLHQAAVNTDPRLQQIQLLGAQSDLRLRNVAAGRLPSVSVDGQAQYQSDVATPILTGTGGRPLFSQPRATVDSGLRVEQRLFDATIGAQDALERAQLAEQQARVRATLFGLRQQVSDAFFAAAMMAGRQRALAVAVSDLAARLNETSERVREGAALPAEAATIEATLLQRRQDEDQLRAARQTALARLAIITGQAVTERDTLVMPDVTAAVGRARQASGELRARPEYDLFARTRDRLATQQDLTAAQERPRVSGFAKVGFGRPGLNFVSDQFDSYGLGGVRVQWNAWTWGSGGRERQALALQQQIVAADQAAFARGLDQSTEGDAATIDRLHAALALDDRIIALREQIEGSTQARFQEGVVTASDLVDRSGELLQARLARVAHQVELAQAGARLLTTLGLEVR